MLLSASLLQRRAGTLALPIRTPSVDPEVTCQIGSREVQTVAQEIVWARAEAQSSLEAPTVSLFSAFWKANYLSRKEQWK